MGPNTLKNHIMLYDTLYRLQRGQAKKPPKTLVSLKVIIQLTTMSSQIRYNTESKRFYGFNSCCMSCGDIVKAGRRFKYFATHTLSQNSDMKIEYSVPVIISICDRPCCQERIKDKTSLEFIDRPMAICCCCKKETKDVVACNYCNWDVYCSEECKNKHREEHSYFCDTIAIHGKAKRIYHQLLLIEPEENPREFTVSMNQYISILGTRKKMCTFCLNNETTSEFVCSLDKDGKDKITLYSCREKRCFINHAILKQHLELPWKVRG